MAKKKTGLHRGLSDIIGRTSSEQKTDNGKSEQVEADESSASTQKNAQQNTQQTQGPRPGAWSLSTAMPPEAISKLKTQQAKSDGLMSLFKRIPWQIFESRTDRINSPGLSTLPSHFEEDKMVTQVGTGARWGQIKKTSHDKYVHKSFRLTRRKH